MAGHLNPKPTWRPPGKRLGRPRATSQSRLRTTDPGQPGENNERRREATIVFAGNRIGNKFRLIAPLGDGGMGKVWLAMHLGLRRRVALKVLHRSVHASQDHRKRFEREAVAIGALSHPGIVDALDFGELEDGRSYLVMEYVSGQTLEQLLVRRERLDWRDAVRIAAQVADALEYAHQQGVIHRDLKPDNVIVEGGDLDKGRVCILDLGLARVEGACGMSLSERGFAMGTVSYSAPEQLRGEPVDRRADVFGLGAVLYRLVTGSTPYPGAEFHDVVMSQQKRLLRHPRLAHRDRTRPISLDALVMRCLSHDPAARPQSAAELRDALLEIDAEPTPTRSWRGVAAAAGLVTLGVAAGVAGAVALLG